MSLASADSLQAWVEYLALDVGPRPWSRPARLMKVAVELESRFADLGFAVQIQPFLYRGNEYANVIAFPPGEEPFSPGPLLIVGAHYDTVPGSPGADDNASGIAGLMELARLVAADPPAGIRLVAFSLEEPPAYRSRHMGSYVFARACRRNGVRLRGMICLEMLGFFTDRPGSQKFPFFFMDRFYPTVGNFIALAGNRRSGPWIESVKKAFVQGSSVPVESISAPAIVIGVDFSDHWSFYKFGYQAVMVTDTAFYRNPNYHRSSDLPHTLDYVRMAGVVDGLSHGVLSHGVKSKAPG